MIEYIKGKITALTPATAVVETADGVAYLLNITLPTYSWLQDKAEAQLLVHESIREDAWVLYAFADEAERALFRLLIGVSGVGAGTARIILSAIPAAELHTIIATGGEDKLKAVKGIGQKTAQRIIVDLKGKTLPVADTAAAAPASMAGVGAYDEALAALQVLGFAKPQCQKALKRVFDENPTLAPGEAVRKALPLL